MDSDLTQPQPPVPPIGPQQGSLGLLARVLFDGVFAYFMQTVYHFICIVIFIIFAAATRQVWEYYGL